MPTSKLLKVVDSLAITETWTKTVPINVDNLASELSTVHIAIESVTGTGTIQASIKGSLIENNAGVQLHTDEDGQVTETGNIIASIASPFEYLNISVGLGTFTDATISVYVIGAV